MSSPTPLQLSEQLALTAAALLRRAAGAAQAEGELVRAFDLAQWAGTVQARIEFPRQTAALKEFYQAGAAGIFPRLGLDVHPFELAADSAGQLLPGACPVPQRPSAAAPRGRHSSAQSKPAADARNRKTKDAR